MRATAPWIRSLMILFALAGGAPGPATRPATTPAAPPPATNTRPAPVYRAATQPAKPLKLVPETADDLRALQAEVKDVVARVAPAVVGLRVGGGQGSGVIISEDGFVLTAGHVCSAPDRDVVIMLA